ncbi:hypothetical protein DNK56_26230 [Streptomyces sp. AC1-42W]|nr:MULTISPECIES: hypothetical protein [unclassified Streptomyces]PZT76781.1 hypothetical protein DNK56_26230 [Streptomyces sp. AC1-42W]PZT80569.1 hypothetical protein DNK55_06450 [Streptomyces sp. AC1-42T]
MRPLRTDAERAEAAALVQDHQRWLALSGLAIPADISASTLSKAPATPAVGLFENGLLLACMTAQRVPDLAWGGGPCLFLGHVHILPDRLDDTARLITLWGSDAAAREDLPLVRTEMPARGALAAEPLASRLRRLIDLGWDLRGPGPGRNGDRVARLELVAEQRSGLSALIGDDVRMTFASPPDRTDA